jgi:hypothetical protein
VDYEIATPTHPAAHVRLLSCYESIIIASYFFEHVCAD